ncbi:hypothetical protein GW17_00038868, partial [Ensete ventricosum]
MATPLAGVASHGQPPCRGGWLRPRPSVVAIACKRRLCRPRPGRKRRLPATRPHGAVASGQPVRANRQWPARKGLSPVASPTASKGSGAGRKGGRPLAG